MAADGRMKAPLYVQFVMGVKNAMPVDKPTFDFYIETVKRLAPGRAAGAGPGSGRARSCSTNGRSRRAGIPGPGSRTTSGSTRAMLAPSNAALVERAVALCEKYGRKVASAAEARAILGLKAA